MQLAKIPMVPQKCKILLMLSDHLFFQFCDSKELRSDNFCYRIVERAITKLGAIENSRIYIAIALSEKKHFDRVPNIISPFWGNNNIFANCMWYRNFGILLFYDFRTFLFGFELIFNY